MEPLAQSSLSIVRQNQRMCYFADMSLAVITRRPPPPALDDFSRLFLVMLFERNAEQ